MLKMSLYFYTASFMALVSASILYVLYSWRRRESLGKYATILAVNGMAFLTLSLLFRWIASGHAPYSNQYEFAVSFAWGIGSVYLYIENRNNSRSLGVFVLPIAVALLAYAATIPSDIQPLIPALQSPWLTFHVASAVIAYGAFAVAFGSSVMYLLRRYRKIQWLPSEEALDGMGFRSVAIGFPAQFLVLVLGSIWANTAWGNYWSWDPKETASLVTWLIYAGYFHTRGLRGWRGTRSAVFLMVGFGAVVFTYFGNYFLGGLHTYSGL